MPPGEVGLLRYRGHLAPLDVEGSVTLRGRQKDMIIRAGIDARLDFARARRPCPKWPRQIVVVDDLPRNSSGKVLKRDLAQRASAAGQV